MDNGEKTKVIFRFHSQKYNGNYLLHAYHDFLSIFNLFQDFSSQVFLSALVPVCKAHPVVLRWKRRETFILRY